MSFKEAAWPVSHVVRYLKYQNVIYPQTCKDTDSVLQHLLLDAKVLLPVTNYEPCYLTFKMHLDFISM